jgi:hypothetical protein
MNEVNMLMVKINFQFNLCHINQTWGDYIKLSQVSICVSTFGLYIHSHRLQI